jgi:hypothetical protein
MENYTAAEHAELSKCIKRLENDVRNAHRLTVGNWLGGEILVTESYKADRIAITTARLDMRREELEEATFFSPQDNPDDFTPSRQGEQFALAFT